MADDIADVAEVVYYVEDSASPLTIVKPAAFAPTQLLALVIAHDAIAGNLGALTGPPGWADKGNYNDIVGGSAGRLWTHPYNAADPGTWDFGYDSGSTVAAALMRITGADLTPLVNLTSHVGAQVLGTVDSPTVTPTGVNDLLTCALCSVSNGNAFTETDPTDMTNRGQVQALDLYMAVAIATQQLTTGSATGAKTWTSVSPATSAGGTFSITIKSSGFIDPDPPPNPVPATVPPWLLRQLLVQKQAVTLGNQRTPVVKEKLSGGASGANVTLNTAVTTDVNDLLVVFHGNNFYTAAQLLTPTGTAGSWTNQVTGDNGTDSAHMKIWTRLVTSSGAQTVTCAQAIDEEHTVQLFVVSGVDPANYVDGVAGGNGAASTTHTSPSVPPVTLNALLMVGAQSTSVGDYSIPNALGMIKTSEVDVGSFCTAAVGAEVLATGGATGARTWTLTTSGAFASASIALRSPQDTVAGVTNVNAEAAQVTVVAADAQPSVGQPAVDVALTVAALDASVAVNASTNVAAEQVAITVVAQDAAQALTVNGVDAALSASALNASAAVNAVAELVVVTVAANDALISVTSDPAPSAVTLTVTSNDATQALLVNAVDVSATVVALDALVVTGVSVAAENVTNTVTAGNASLTIAPTETGVAETVVAGDASQVVAPAPGEATLSVSALDATVSTATITNAPAGLASATTTVDDAACNVAPILTESQVGGVAHNAVAAVGALAAEAAQTIVSQVAAASVVPTVTSADVTVSAPDATITTSAALVTVSVTSVALDATVTVSVNVAATMAALTLAANTATVTSVATALADVALVTVDALDATIPSPLSKLRMRFQGLAMRFHYLGRQRRETTSLSSRSTGSDFHGREQGE